MGGRWHFLCGRVSQYNSVCVQLWKASADAVLAGPYSSNDDGVSMCGGYMLLICGLIAMFRSRPGPEFLPAVRVGTRLSQWSPSLQQAQDRHDSFEFKW